ncbi:hypothetical protein [Vulcanisaeta thermophila]|nr:hypothetical protein [Vulcanisaeta thermophila]
MNGFHEVRISIEHVKRRIQYIKPLIDELKNEIKD